MKGICERQFAVGIFVHVLASRVLHPRNTTSFHLFPPHLSSDLPMPGDIDSEGSPSRKKKRLRKTYSCSCASFCHGRALTVSKTTYFRHQAVAKVAAAAKAVTEKLAGKRKGVASLVDDDSTISTAHKRMRMMEEDMENAELVALAPEVSNKPSHRFL